MHEKYFEPYQKAIINCINSCTNNLQLSCCFDMIARFIEVFKPSVPPQEMDAKLIAMYEEYYQKQTQLNIV